MEIKCCKCGKDMIWDNDFDLEDIVYDAHGIMSFYHCDDCNVTYEIVQKWEKEGEDE